MKKLSVLFCLGMVSVFLVKCGSGGSKENSDDEKQGALSDTAVYNRFLKEGTQYASETGKVLMKNLTSAISSGGTENAVTFCNINALPLTDSMAAQQLVSIKRVSDKIRNPKNIANQQELEYIAQLKKMIHNGASPKPKLIENEKTVTGYYPIITNALCLNCHGDKTKIDPKTLAKITNLYPADSATGYGINQLRGLWVVEMKK